MRSRSAHLRGAVVLAAPLHTPRPGLIHRPGDGTSLRAAGAFPPEPSICPPLLQAAAAARSATKGVPPTSILCRTTANFLASATLALRRPARLAMRAAQLFSAEPFTGRVRMTFAASYSAVRTPASPTLLMRPVTSVSPDWYFLGARPKCAPTAFEDRNRVGSSTAATKVSATITPTPGAV